MSNAVFTPLSVIQRQMETGFPYWAIYEPDGTSITENLTVKDTGQAYELLCTSLNELDGQYVLLTLRNVAPPRKTDGEDALQKSAKKNVAGDRRGTSTKSAGNAGKTFRYRVKLAGYSAGPVGQGLAGMGGGMNPMFQMLLDQNKTIAGLEAARREDLLQRQIDDLKKAPASTGTFTSQLIEGLAKQVVQGIKITKDGISFDPPGAGMAGTGATLTPNTQAIPDEKKDEVQKRWTDNINFINSKLKGNEIFFYEGIRKLAEMQPDIFEAQAAEIINVGKA